MYKLSSEEQSILDSANQILMRVMEATPLFLSKEVISSDDVAVQHFRYKIGHAEREHMMVLFLDNQHCLLASEILFSGTTNQSAVYPREIVKRALTLNACAIIIGHNHPSGSLEVSQADRIITEKIQSVCELVGIKLVDHIIVSPLGYRSFSAEGYL